MLKEFQNIFYYGHWLERSYAQRLVSRVHTARYPEKRRANFTQGNKQQNTTPKGKDNELMRYRMQNKRVKYF